MEFVVVRHLFCVVFSSLLAFYLVPMFINAAFRFNILDIPDGKIKNHKKATPYLGGLAIYVPFIATLAIAYPFENKILWLLLGSTFLLFVGLIDDMKCLKPSQKLFGQFIAVICFLKGGFSLKTNFFSDFFNIFASAFWMLLIINAFNLVDVMDGLSSVLAIVSSLSFFVIALFFGQYELSLLLLTFTIPLIVFLFYNRPPAKIYLGDTGSLYIGGFMSAIPLLFPWSSISFESYYAPIIILGIPILEVVTLVVIRTYKCIPFFRGSPHHFSIYLRKKWSVLKVLLFSSIMSLILSLIAILFLFKFISFIYLIIFILIFLVFWFYFIFSN
ncbi:MAG: MraY family glycosyltransferase [Candidatus Babeliales bacterium]